jgi:hypothetical protein
MRIVKIETYQGDGGLRRLSFLKITTDRGVTGWAEFAEGSPGRGGLSAVIGAVGSQGSTSFSVRQSSRPRVRSMTWRSTDIARKSVAQSKARSPNVRDAVA